MKLPENRALPEYDYTDLGMSKLWKEMFGDKYVKIPELNEWFYFNDHKWVMDQSGLRVKNTIEQMLTFIATEGKEIKHRLCTLESSLNIFSKKELQKIGLQTDGHKSLWELYELYEANVRWYKAIQSKSRIEAFIGLACQMGANKSYELFDSKGRYIGVRNGCVNLYSGELTQGNPKYLITKSASADYEPSAECPNWIAFLNQIFSGDIETIAFMQRIAGEALLGDDCKTKLLIFSGSGANGKSTYIDTLVALLGDYASVTSPDAIMAGNMSNSYYLAGLKGSRLGVFNETRANAELDSQMIKQLVDSGRLQARQIYGKPFEFQPVITPILVTNNPPIINAEPAISRRLLCVKFDYTIPEDQRDPNFIKNKLKPELSGILNWAIEGCKEYLEHGGLNPPESILKATKEYIFEHDRVLKYVTENFDKDPSSKIAVKAFHKEYVDWCDDLEFESCSSKKLNQRLRSMGYEVKISTGNVYYVFGLARKSMGDKNVIPITRDSAGKRALTDSFDDLVEY